MHRPSCVATEVERLDALLQKRIGKSILGKVKIWISSVRECRLSSDLHVIATRKDLLDLLGFRFKAKLTPK